MNKKKVRDILQYFDNGRHNSADSYTEAVKVRNHARLWDTELAWYSPIAAHRICFNGFGIHSFRPTWSRLIIEIRIDQRHVHLSHNKYFWLFTWCYSPVRTHKK